MRIGREIALQNKQLFDQLKKESIYILSLLVISILALKIIFFKENILVIFRLVISFFFVFIIPGLAFMNYWREKLSFTERLAVGVGVSAALIGITSYYLGLIGLHIKYHTILLPLLIIIIGFYISSRENAKITSS